MDIVRVQAATHREDILRVLERNLPAASGRKRFDWLYLSNPAGQAHVWVAYNKNQEPVGTSAAIPRKIRIGDSIVEGLVLSDFAIDEAYRSLGPALKMLRATLEPVMSGEFELTYDYPSRSMYAIYSRLGAKALGPENRYVRLISVSHGIRQHVRSDILSSTISKLVDSIIGLRDSFARTRGSVQVETYIGEFSSEFSEVSNIICSSRSIFVDRNTQYLNWRFRQHPDRRHFVSVARKNGRLVGYVISHSESTEVLMIDEFVCESCSDARVSLLNHTVDIARSENVEKIQCAMLEDSPVEALLANSSFYYRDSGIGPVVFARPESGTEVDINEGDCWWLGEGDKDG